MGRGGGALDTRRPGSGSQGTTAHGLRSQREAEMSEDTKVPSELCAAVIIAVLKV